MQIKSETWLAATNQRWKVVVAVCGGLATLVSFAWFVSSLDDDGALGRTLAAFAGSGSFTVAWTLSAVRCPSCGHRPVWRLLRTERADAWVARLLTLERCPSCGWSDTQFR